MLHQQRGEFKPAPAHGASVPIYVPGREGPVGHVSGGAFRKTIRSAKGHLLRVPPAICFDESSLIDAQAAGAQWVVITDADTGTVYRAPMERVRSRCFDLGKMRGGFTGQVGLRLEEWSVNGAPSEREAQEAREAAHNCQLGLFDDLEPA